MNNPAIVMQTPTGNFIVVRRRGPGVDKGIAPYEVYGHYGERQKAVRHRRYLNRFLRNSMKTGIRKSGRN